MADLIIAMPRAEDAKKVAELLRGRGLTPGAVVTNGADALQSMNSMDYGVLLCSSKFPDMGFAEISEYMPKYFRMVLMTRDPDLDYSFSHIVKLLMPFRAAELIEVISTEMEAQDRLYKKKRQKPVKRAGEERELIDRAKLLLMEKTGMSEPESYRYIQKCSMDTGTKMVEAAEMVLLLYESS